MDQRQTIGTVSKNLGISSRMLRYYEQIGLIESKRVENYAYRVYDEEAIRRLRQIILLRKLRVSVKQIRELFGNSSALGVIEVFEKNIRELDEQMTDETLQKLEDKDVRIIYLPPMTVAAARFSGEAEYGVGPEATGMIEKFVYETELLKIKPDARGRGFDCSRADLRVEVGLTPPTAH